MHDVIVIGAGPIGLACGLEARRAGLDALVVEKGALVNSLVGYPTNMEFFSTPDLLEIGGYPLVCRGYKPLREEAIDYYRRVAEAEELRINLFEAVDRLEGTMGDFAVHTDRATHRARFVIAATGFFDQPNRLDVPGADLPRVLHYYKEPFAYARRKVAVVGGKNSAAKAALECQRYGAEVTLIHRGPDVSPSVKYWIRPNLLNRIEEGKITAYFDTVVEEIRDGALLLSTPAGPVEIANDVVLALTGYRPDYDFLERLGLEFEGPHRVPVYDEATFESSRPGLYLAGTMLGGLNTSAWFIENGRFHARQIARHIAARA
jgi:thioredoxin reductase (NADPH)